MARNKGSCRVQYPTNRITLLIQTSVLPSVLTSVQRNPVFDTAYSSSAKFILSKPLTIKTETLHHCRSDHSLTHPYVGQSRKGCLIKTRSLSVYELGRCFHYQPTSFSGAGGTRKNNDL
ncbi:hypothetical protein JTE90_024085 [Oedothorax gibbosus]|uniref:Uncharacterized protein n=1 Tax=Oedothorax gibbosus TaxID=931172 RepID=A0AAV6URL7_9ARAC|nr:hypothetical protein JTE90_024085 [Oedothorax gibbosus]